MMLARYSDHLQGIKATISNSFLDMLKVSFGPIDEAKGTLKDLGVK
jgi:hypothetical protein